MRQFNASIRNPPREPERDRSQKYPHDHHDDGKTLFAVIPALITMYDV